MTEETRQGEPSAEDQKEIQEENAVCSEEPEELPKREPKQQEEKEEGVQEEAAELKEEDEKETLLKQVKELEEKLRESEEKELRHLAEFENYRKRTSKEIMQSRDHGIADLACEILGVLDNLERALQVETQEEEFKSGVQMIAEQLKEVLKKFGIQEVEAMGEPFDPTLFNAVTQVENDQFEENTVCEVLQKGYRMGDKIIRHAMVVVANP